MDALVERAKYEEAILYFRRALNHDYGQTDWRMKLAFSQYSGIVAAST